MLAILTAELRAAIRWLTGQLRSIFQIVQAETVFGWHRDMVRRKWSYVHRNKGGRLKIAQWLESGRVYRLLQWSLSTSRDWATDTDPVSKI